MIKFPVTKNGKGWVVRGEIVLNEGRTTQAYERFFTVRSQAYRHAEMMVRIESATRADNAYIRRVRLGAVQEYLAQRKQRKTEVTKQLNLF